MTRISKLFKKQLSLALIVLVIFSQSVSLVQAQTLTDNKSNFTQAKISKPDIKLPDKLEEASKIDGMPDQNENVKVIVKLKEKPIIENYSLSKSKLLPSEYIKTSGAKQDKKKILDEQDKVKKEISNKIKGASFHNSFNYTIALNGFSVEMLRKDINDVKKLDGVKNVFEVVTYTLPDETSGINPTLQDIYSSELIGADLANSTNYTGKRTVVAVLDSGLDTSHEAFSTMPPESSLKYSKTVIGDLVKDSDLQASKITSISDNQTYVSDKVPYAFDYADRDINVTGGVDHGTHVSGIIAGNNTAKQTADDKIFKGIAPDAQLMMMKVFGNGTGSTSDDIILAGLEDAIVLGADAINMSLGSPAGFRTSGDAVTDEVYGSVNKAGINLELAAGNETSSSAGNTTGVNLNPAESPDTSIVGGPSTVDSALSVASCENSHYQSKYFVVGGADGIKVPYSNAVNVNNNYEILITAKLNNQTKDYVILDKYGLPDDYKDVDVTGKIVVVNRGGNTFEAKAVNAKAAGAVAVIIVNNVPGAIATPGVTTSDIIPMVGVAQNAGKILEDVQIKTIYISSANQGMVENPGAGLISSFSSIGPSPELGIKPEITAPGGNIYSSINGGRYALMSGTSMATPHLAGVSALIKQYVNNDNRFTNLTPEEKAELVTNLEMSTSNPIKNTEGIYYPVRQQGSGLVNVFKAVNSPAYLTVNGGRPKAELGSSSDGIYKINFTINNISDKTISYKLNTTTLTGKLQSEIYFAANPRQLSGEESVVTGSDTVSVPANSKTEVTVNIKLSDAVKQELKGQFKNGIYIEGFVQLKSQDDQGIDLSLPFLGYYGSWEDVPIYDTPIYDGTPLWPAYTALFNLDANYQGLPLGVNTATNPPLIKKDKIAFSTKAGFGGYLAARLSLLRNTDNLTFSITSEDGITEYWKDNYGQARKTFLYAPAGAYIPTFPNTFWDGKDQNGNPVAENAKLVYNITGTTVGSNKEQKLSFPFTIDNTAPVISDAKTYEEDGKTYLEFNASDNQSIKFIMFTDASGHVYALDNYIPESDDKAITVKVDITGLAGSLQEGGYNPGTIAVYTYDYAYNNSIDYIEFGPTAIILDGAQSIKTGAKVTINAAVKPEQYSGSVIKWSVDNEAIGTIDQNGTFTAKSQGIATITATTGTGLKAATKVYVDTPLPDGSGITEPDKNTSLIKPILDNQYGDLSIDGDHKEITDNLNTVFRFDGFDYRITGKNEVQLIQDQSVAGLASRTADNKENLMLDQLIDSYSYKAGDADKIEDKVEQLHNQLVNENTSLAGYADKTGDIVLPDTVKYNDEDYKVTSIGYRAFYSASNITSVVIPEGVKIIGKQAFTYANKMTKVVLPDSVERIDDSAFAWQSDTAVNIPKKLKYIGNYAFANNKKLTDVTLNAGFQELGHDAFAMSSITSAYLPDGVKAIGQNAFLNTSNLSKVRLPNDLKRIPKTVFFGSGIKSIDLPEGLEVIGCAAFEASKLTSVTIPSTVVRIESFAFSDIDFTGASLVIPESVQIIQEYAFRYVLADSISVGANAKRIDMNAFLGCKAKITAANATVAKQIHRSEYSGNIAVGGSEFSDYVPGLFVVNGVVYRPTSDTTAEVRSVDNINTKTELIIPEKVTDKGNNITYTVTSVASLLTKYGKEKLIKIVLPDTIERIGERAFDQLMNLTTFNYPKNLKEVGYQALGYPGYLKKDTYYSDKDLEIPQSIEWAEDCAFAGTKESAITVPQTIDYINDYEFAGGIYLKNVTLNDSITAIKTGAFMGDKLLTSIDLPNSLAYIGDDAFNGTGLSSVIIPNSVKFIGSKALDSVKEVTLGGSVDSFGWNSFAKDAKISVVLNSQLEDVVKFNSLNQLPTLKWDGSTAINADDSSVVPEGSTVDVSQDQTQRSSYTKRLNNVSTSVYGKMIVNGTLNIPKGEILYLDGELTLNGKITGHGKLILGKDVNIDKSKIDSSVIVIPNSGIK